MYIRRLIAKALKSDPRLSMVFCSVPLVTFLLSLLDFALVLEDLVIEG